MAQTQKHETGPRTVRAPHGSQLHCKGWLQEAAYRMIQNNLDPAVAEKPDELIVYGGLGKAARNWEAFEKILKSLQILSDENRKTTRLNPLHQIISYPVFSFKT